RPGMSGTASPPRWPRVEGAAIRSPSSFANSAAAIRNGRVRRGVPTWPRASWTRYARVDPRWAGTGTVTNPMEARIDTSDIVDDFVGRAEELALLDADLAALPSPAGPIRLLTGPAGVGKTRLAQELCRRAGPAHTVVWSTCPDVLSAPPYWPW